jgi:hypothetical protein
MEAVSLSTFLKRVPLLKQIVFPTDEERNILAASVLDILTYEDKDGNEDNERTADYFVRYVKEIELRKDGENLQFGSLEMVQLLQYLSFISFISFSILYISNVHYGRLFKTRLA